jgi:hypothetical protein
MIKINDTPNFSHGTKDHGTLADGVLSAVTGGTKAGIDSARMSIKVSPEYTRQHLTGSGHLP